MKTFSNVRVLISSLALVLALGLTTVSCSKKQTVAGEGEGTETYSVNDSDIASGRADSDSNNAMGLKTVYFPFDSFELTGESKATLQQNAEILKSNPALKIQIEGHCDERGGIQYNLALGEKRANAARRQLQAMGVANSRIETISLGKERPIALGQTETDHGQNRRANFVITSK